jgi:hypothetical protein
VNVSYVEDIRSGDWCGLYVNGELVLQGHSLDPMQILSAVKEHQNGVAIKELHYYEVDLEKLDLDRCPQRFVDLWI